MVAKKKSTKKSSKPKTKTVYRTKTVYVKEKNDDENPFGQVMPMVGAGMGAIVGIGVAGAIGKALNPP